METGPYNKDIQAKLGPPLIGRHVAVRFLPTDKDLQAMVYVEMPEDATDDEIKDAAASKLGHQLKPFQFNMEIADTQIMEDE